MLKASFPLFLAVVAAFVAMPASASAAQAAPRPPLWFVGQSFAGLPLTDRAEGPPGVVNFSYGTCDPIPDGCAEPLSIQNWLLRRRHPRMIFGRCVRVSVRGVPAAFFQFSGGLDVYVGRRTVVIFADRKRLMLRAAQALRRIDRPEARGRLPRPPQHVYRALRRCSPGAALTG